MNMEESYWKYVEPIWDSVSINNGGDIFVEQFSKLTEKEQVLFASHWAQSEILNGGLGQFFSNSTGVLAPEAAEALIKLGMPISAQAIKNAMLFFGEPYPRGRSLREEAFEEFFKKNGETAIPMEEQENIVAEEIEEENGGFEVAANLFASKC
jgi:hypothetical protein